MKKIFFLLLMFIFGVNVNCLANDRIDVKQANYLAWCSDACRVEVQDYADKKILELDELIKSQNYEGFYEESDEIFRKKISIDQWKTAFQDREKVGLVSSRSHESTQGIFKTLPNLEKGNDYFIITYDTFFENTQGIYTEQITLIKREGTYKFIGYYISKKPTYDY